MNDVRTVSDTKRAFYSLHTRPINSIYRRVVEELMVETHLLLVNASFRYDPIYALGVVTTYDRFMQGYRPEQDKVSIFNALCQAVGGDPQVYRQDAERLLSEAAHLSPEDVVSKVRESSDPADGIIGVLRGVAGNPGFKYSRLFAIGVYTLLEQMDGEMMKDDARRNAALQSIGDALNLSADKMQKDLELYRSNLDKMTQARAVLDDILKADRKKKEERAKAKEERSEDGAIATPPSSPSEPS